MKTFEKCRQYVFVIACTLVLLSCDKPILSTEPNTQVDLEGYNSTTGNSETVLEKKNLEISVPLLHAHFDKVLSKEETGALFDQMVTKYMKSYERTGKGVSTEWFYKIRTYTGTQTNNGTDGEVIGLVNFSTDKGDVTRYTFLNNPGDDREGGWDLYFIRTAIAGQAVSWVEVKNGKLFLKGTDGWFPKVFEVSVNPWEQSVSATGGSGFISEPNVWLDNNSASSWDIYSTPTNIGIWTLYF